MYARTLLLNILITNRILAGRSGTEVVVRDLCSAFTKRGHHPMVYSPTLGPTAEELRADGIEVYRDIREIDRIPDVIHGHHHPQTLIALLRFPNTPAIFVCHDAVSWHDDPLIFPRVLRYVAVDNRCRRRLEHKPQIRPESIRLVLNAVDLSRFAPRPPLPAQPQRAVIFSNYASLRTQVPAIQTACNHLIIPCDVIGQEYGNVVSQPEHVLPKYDLVFAKARCALEAMAVGCAVVVCDFGGLGQMVRPQTVTELRALNFGGGVLTRPLDPELIANEIRKYDGDEAKLVSDRVRREADLICAVDEWIEIYEQVVSEHAAGGSSHAEELAALADYVAEWGYDARIAWEEKRIAKSLDWPVVGTLLRYWLKK
jgi:glycosyltransferase involved in cell wall biosynthesis